MSDFYKLDTLQEGEACGVKAVLSIGFNNEIHASKVLEALMSAYDSELQANQASGSSAASFGVLG